MLMSSPQEKQCFMCHLQLLSSQGDKNEIQNKVLKRKLISIFFYFVKCMLIQEKRLKKPSDNQEVL